VVKMNKPTPKPAVRHAAPKDPHGPAFKEEGPAVPTVLREPVVVAKPPPTAAAVFVYVNGQRRDVPAGTLASALGRNVRHTDVEQKRVAADERVVHGLKYLAE
jgi:hypothetical protein